MPSILFCGDPHSSFRHIIRAVDKHAPEAIVLLGDQTCEQPLEVELAEISHKTKIYWIGGNHDTDNDKYYDNLFESKLKGRNIQNGVIGVAGITIAGIGGVFREKLWNGNEDSNLSPANYLKSCGASNKWRGGLPLRYRSTIFPSQVKDLAGMHVDVLVTHEAPDLHRHGNAALTRLAESLRVKKAFHGHHHQFIDYPGGVWTGVSLRGIVALDTETFELTQIDAGQISTKPMRDIAEPRPR